MALRWRLLLVTLTAALLIGFGALARARVEPVSVLMPAPFADASADLVQEFNSKPQTYAETFQLAGQHQLIPMELAQRLIPAAGLHNRLVHDYEAIDPSRVHAALPIALRDLSELAAAVADRVRI